MAASSKKEVLAALYDVYTKKFSKTGVSYTGDQLRQAVKKEKKIDVEYQDVFEFLRRHTTGAVAALQTVLLDQKVFQTVGVTKSGVFFIDYGEFHKSWKRQNGGCTGFLVAVENLTNRLFVYPTKGKDTKQWLDSIAKFIEGTRDVKIIYSDRDAVATSPKFRRHVQSKYGLKWKFLKKGNKSFLAERYIRYVKIKLSQALKSGVSKDRNWTEYVEEIVKTYNNQIIPGTTYKRGSISDVNFDRFASQLFKSKQIDLERYNSFAAGPFESSEWNKRAFKFQIGDKVLLSRAANWKKGVPAGGAFAKASVDGAYGETEYTISGRQLRADRNYKILVPVYSLAEFGGNQHLHFYENELVLRTRVPSTSKSR